MAAKRRPGMVSLAVLVGMGLLTTVTAGLLGVTRQALYSWQLKEEARQAAYLFRSLCRVREGEPLLVPGEHRALEPVVFRKDRPGVYGSLTGLADGPIREERIRLHRDTGEELMAASRYEITMPGTEKGETFPETGIWAEGRKQGKLWVDWSRFGRCRTQTLPDTRRMEVPLEGVFCYGRETLQWPEKTERPPCSRAAASWSTGEASGSARVSGARGISAFWPTGTSPSTPVPGWTKSTSVPPEP